MNIDKLKKLESIIKQKISTFIIERLSDNDNIFWIITITSVQISTDLSYSDIYISCFKNKNKLTKVLATYAYAIQKELNKSIKIRKIPRIRFKYDESSELTFKVEKQINKYCNI